MKFLKILSKKICKFAKKIYIKEHQNTGEVAQLARASHWQCEGRGFESLFLHHDFPSSSIELLFFVLIAQKLLCRENHVPP